MRIAIIGMGLIGTSLGMALRSVPAKESPFESLTIIGYDQERRNTREARGRLAIDSEAASLSDAVRGANLVVIATPVGAIEAILGQLASQLAAGAVVTDVASTKEMVVAQAARLLPSGVAFIGGHPMAGRERSGPAAADPELFNDAIYCLTPGTNTPSQAIELVETVVKMTKAKPYYIDPAEHDAYVAGISHLPFVLASTLVTVTGRSPAWKEMAPLAATGFRDTTRVASGDATMYRDIALSNRAALERWLGETVGQLNELRERIQLGDAAYLEEFFSRAREQREGWLDSRPNLRPGEADFYDRPTVERPNLFGMRGPRPKK